jgi:hypothetical protein
MIMKRFLLLSLILSMVMLGYSQKGTKIPRVMNDVEKQAVAKLVTDEGVGFENPNSSNQVHSTFPKGEEPIGTTWYDLQTNSALSNRLYVHPDGTKSAVWTMSFDGVYNDRGTGYNYKDETNTWGPAPTARIENVKTGWPSIAPWGENGEIIVAHTGVATGLYFNKRDTKGTGAWESFYLAGPDASNVLVWPRMITTGENHDVIQVISCGGNAVVYNGQTPALMYSRSFDGGASWDPLNLVIEEIGPDYYENVNADEYTWADPVGNTIAFGVTDPFKDWFVMKSTDGGDNWEKIIIWENPYFYFIIDPGITTDTVWSPDGSGDIDLDSDGNVHAVTALLFWYKFEVGTTYNFFPGLSDGIVYWNESMPPFTAADQHDALDPYDVLSEENVIGWSPDVNGNGILEIGDPYTTDIFAYRTPGLCTMPSMSVSSDNKIHVAFAATTEGYTYNNPPQYNYKHIWTTSSEDGGATWSDLFDVTSGLLHTFDECTHPVVSKGGDNVMRLIYQYDDIPGTALNTTPDHDPHQNGMVYYSAINTAIENNIAGSSMLSVAQSYPNPAVSESFVEVKLSEKSELTLEVTNMIGQVVYEINKGSVNAGTHVLRIDVSKLDSGVYFYTVKANESSVTKKMIVE